MCIPTSFFLIFFFFTYHRGERNFHIFYQMTCGAPADLRKKYHIGQPDDYRYLNMGRTLTR